MNHCKHYDESRDGHIAKLAGELVHKLKTRQITRGMVEAEIKQAGEHGELLKAKINQYLARSL